MANPENREAPNASEKKPVDKQTQRDLGSAALKGAGVKKP